MRHYPKGSKLVAFHEWSERGLRTVETAVLNVARSCNGVLERRDIGLEYFEGDKMVLIRLVYNTVHEQLCHAMSNETVPPEGQVDLQHTTEPADAERAVILFVQAHEGDLDGTCESSWNIYTRFVAFCQSHACGHIRAASKMKHEWFARKLIGQTGASSVVVRKGLIVERHIKFHTDHADAVTLWCKTHIVVTKKKGRLGGSRRLPVPTARPHSGQGSPGTQNNPRLGQRASNTTQGWVNVRRKQPKVGSTMTQSAFKIRNAKRTKILDVQL